MHGRGAVAAAVGVSPSNLTRSTISAQLYGLARAFSWMFIRSFLQLEVSQPQSGPVRPDEQLPECSQLERDLSLLATTDCVYCVVLVG